MSIIAYIISIINMMGILISSLYIFKKSINYLFSIKNKILTTTWFLLWIFLYTSHSLGIPFLVLIYSLNIIFIWKLTKIKYDIVISAYLLSIAISYSLLGIAMFFVSFIFAPFLGSGYEDSILFDFNKPIYLLFYSVIAIFQFLLAYFLFQIKRFKNGFSFLLEKYSIILSLILTGLVLALVSWLSMPREKYGNNYIFIPYVAIIIIIGIGIIIWFRRGINMFYIRKMKEQTIESLEQQLLGKEQKIQYLTEQNNALRINNHKIIHRLAALEQATVRLLEQRQNYSTEFSKELTITIESIKQLSQEYHNNTSQIKNKKPLPPTKINMLDNIFEYFSKQCVDNKIEFNLKISGSIPYMIEHIIPQSKLEIMIGDHLQDAMIAVNASNNSFRNILAILGISSDCYEFTVYDSGIQFDTDTLTRLGTERVTTHADSGGSGIGFMTTFEAMRECGASLIINEKRPSDNDYSKSVTIRFDSKNQYVIETYRPNEFPTSDRYIIVSTGNKILIK